MARKTGLGRGLGSLFVDIDDNGEKEKKVENIGVSETGGKEKDTTPVKKKEINEEELAQVKTSLVFPNPNQPRKKFDEQALHELAESIRVHGIIQPITVVESNEGFMIIAGERRWRAANLIGLETVPVIVKNYGEKKILEVSLIENLQREDLNVIEAAYAMKRLMEDFHFTQEDIADRLGKSRPAVANTLRLLSLHPEVISLVEQDNLSAGHARCLVVISDTQDQIKFAKEACGNKLTVRDLEKKVKQYLEPSETQQKIKEQSPELKDLVLKLTRALGTRVSAIGNDSKGRLYIDYFTRDDLERIFNVLTTGKQN